MSLNIRWPIGHTVADSYRVESLITETRQGELYAASDLRTAERVALKRLRPDWSLDHARARRFLLEGRLASRLNLPGITRVLANGDDRSDGSLFLVQEYLSGVRLDAYLSQVRKLTVREAMGLVIPIAEALQLLHEESLVHGSISPETVFIVQGDGECPRPKLLDFGHAYGGDDNTPGKLRTVASVLGYLSPERLLGSSEREPRSDIWSLGTMIYEMLAGSPPFDAPTPAAAIEKILHCRIPVLREVDPDCPGALSALVGRMLARVPRERPGSMSQLVNELSALSREFEAAVSVPQARVEG